MREILNKKTCGNDDQNELAGVTTVRIRKKMGTPDKNQPVTQKKTWVTIGTSVATDTSEKAPFQSNTLYCLSLGLRNQYVGTSSQLSVCCQWSGAARRGHWSR